MATETSSLDTDRSKNGSSRPSRASSSPSAPQTIQTSEIAISIGSHRLVDYVHLNLASCRSLFGPEARIIVVDGKSDNSQKIESICRKYDADFLTDEGQYGHFAGDIMNTVSGLAYAEAVEAKLYIKLNQRFILCGAGVKDQITSIFNDNVTELALPGKARRTPSVRSPVFYFRFPHLVDIVMLKVGSISPAEIRDLYEKQCREARNRDQYLVEYFWDAMTSGRFLGKTKTIDWLTNHRPGRPKEYLRKIQNPSGEFKALSMRLNLPGSLTFDTREWGSIKGRGFYKPAPDFSPTVLDIKSALP